MRRLTPALLVCVALLSVGCGSSSDQVGSDEGPSSTDRAPSSEPGGDEGGSDLGAALEGRTFLATSITVDGSERPLVDGTELKVDLADGTLGMSAGCNGMSVGYAVVGTTLVTDGEVASTLVGCEPDLQAQDEWISELLTRDIGAELDGDGLVLTAGDTVVTLEDEAVGAADAELTGTEWTVDTLHLRDVASTPPPGVVATLRFADDGTYAVNTGCNTGSGTFEAGDDVLTFVPPALTRTACKGGADTLEQAVVAVLDGEVAFTLTEDRLSLAEVQTADGDAPPLGGSGLGLTTG